MRAPTLVRLLAAAALVGAVLGCGQTTSVSEEPAAVEETASPSDPSPTQDAECDDCSSDIFSPPATEQAPAE